MPLFVSLCACLSIEAEKCGGEPRNDQRPNIVFILADDLGYGDLRCYGGKRIETPCLDQMAAEGMRFTQAYAGSTVCAPSRCVLLTGLHLGHCFIRGNGKENLRPDDLTVAEVVRSAGYATAMTGKWGIGHEGSSGVPTRQGFDYFFGYLDQHHAHNYYPAFLMRNEQRVSLSNEVTQVGAEGGGYATKKLVYSHDLLADEALKFIDRSKDQAFFLYVPLTLPHANNEANRALGNGAEVPDYGIYKNQPWPDPDKGQAAMVSLLDRDVGRILERLKKQGIDEKTVVFFSSDNGPHKESGNDPEFFDANGPLRGMKRDLYEGGIRVPMIVRWPGKVQPGSVSDLVTDFTDFLATAADLAGAPIPRQTDGVSMVPTLLGQAESQKKRPYLYWEFYERGSAQAVRMGKWKAVRLPAFTGKMELYDLSQDIGETRDVADEHPDVVAKAAAAMKEAHTPSERWQVQGRPGKGKKS